MDSTPFKFAADSAKEIIAFSTVILTFTATFAKDTFLARSTKLPLALGASWIMYLLSVMGGVWTLLALTGTLGSPNQNEPSIWGPNVIIPASVMTISFLLGLIFTAGAGWQAVRKIICNGSSENKKHEENVKEPINIKEDEKV